MPEYRPKRPWYHITPDRLIIGLLAVEGFLLLSERFQWFAFNEKKGWTVLIAVAAVCLAVVVMLLWLAASLLFRWRFQFCLRSLVVLVVAVAVPCCWLSVKMRQAERQRRAVEAIERVGWGEYDGVVDESGKPQPSVPTWLSGLVGVDLFVDVVRVDFYESEASDVALEHLKGLTNLNHLEFSGTQVTDAGLEHLKGLTNLNYLKVSRTQVTDTGLAHLKGLTELCGLYLSDTQITDVGLVYLSRLRRLKWLVLSSTHVTQEGINELQEALPNCRIIWNPPLPTPTTNLDQP